MALDLAMVTLSHDLTVVALTPEGEVPLRVVTLWLTLTCDRGRRGV